MRFTTILALLAGSLAALPARGGPADADGLIQRGLDLRRIGKSAEALELFRRAYERAPSSRTLGQMGLVETSLQAWTDADRHLRAALATPDDLWVRKNQPFLAQALARASEHVGELVVTGPRGADVSFAGRKLGKLPLATPVRTAEGNFPLQASAAGFKRFATTLTIHGGARVALSIDLEPLGLAPAMQPPATQPPATAIPSPPVTAEPPRPRAHLVLGTALAAAGLGALAWGIAWVAIDDRQSCGGAGRATCGAVYDTKTPGLLLAAAGGALATAGGIVLVKSMRAGASELTVGFAPTALSLNGRF